MYINAELMQKFPEDDLGEIETFRNVDGLCVKICIYMYVCIILIFSAFIYITCELFINSRT